MSRGFIAFVIALSAWCGFTVSADDNSSVAWGIKFSVDGELPGKWHGEHHSVDMYRRGVGFTIGGVSNIYLGQNFYIEPGVSLFYSQYRYKDLVITSGVSSVLEQDPKIYKWGLQIPVVAGYSIDFSDRLGMNIYTGPQVRYAFAGKISLKNEEAIGNLSSDFDLWGINGQRRFDLSWKIGVGFPIDSFVIGVEADLGITDLLKGDMSFRENRIGGTVGYYF